MVCPNPFYQIYEGAALLAGATPVYGEPQDWNGVQLLYVCSPGNPTGAVIGSQDWKQLFELSDRHGFVIASDECYSEIYFDDSRRWAALEAAHQLGRDDFRQAGRVLQPVQALQRAGHALGLRRRRRRVLKQFLLYRTYHGSAMSPAVQRLDRSLERRGARAREPRLYRRSSRPSCRCSKAR